MRRVEGTALENIKPFFKMAAQVAQRATCKRAHCGTVIVSNGIVIGEGYNSPPLDDESQRTCDHISDFTIKPKYDKTCCIHAEWRAIINACKHHPDKIQSSTLYFMRIDEANKFTGAGVPYCTTCSRLAMESGIREFALWHSNGANIYSIAEYNTKSYEFHAI